MNNVEDHDPDVEPVHWNFFDELQDGIFKKGVEQSFIKTSFDAGQKSKAKSKKLKKVAKPKNVPEETEKKV